MTTITREMLKEVLSYNPDTGEFFWKQRRGGKKAWSMAGHTNRRGYVLIHVYGELHYAHRLAWCMHYGNFPPPSKFIDHVNLNKSDNRIVNLRIATKSENAANTRAQSNSKSQIKGISFGNNKWRVRICLNGKQMWLGAFSSIEGAKDAYARNATALFGKFARAYEK